VTEVVLLLLAVIWAAVLLPPWIQNRREGRPSDSIATFRNQLSVLERATPGFMGDNVTRLAPHRAMAPLRQPLSVKAAAHRASEARRRRRDVFLTLLAAAGVTLVAAIFMSGAVWMLHLLVDALLFGYTAMLIQIQQRVAERSDKVAFLPRGAGRAPEPAMLLRRSASS
jgi:hypothetical protein